MSSAATTARPSHMRFVSGTIFCPNEKRRYQLGYKHPIYASFVCPGCAEKVEASGPISSRLASEGVATLPGAGRCASGSASVTAAAAALKVSAARMRRPVSTDRLVPSGIYAWTASKYLSIWLRPRDSSNRSKPLSWSGVKMAGCQMSSQSRMSRRPWASSSLSETMIVIVMSMRRAWHRLRHRARTFLGVNLDT